MDINEINQLNYIQKINFDKKKDRFNKGKKFRAGIKNINKNREVELELEDGLILNARLEEPINAGIGDNVMFEITERTEDRIKLKYIEDEEKKDKRRFDIRI